MVSLRQLSILETLTGCGEMRLYELRKFLEKHYKILWTKYSGEMYWFKYDFSDYMKRMWKRGLVKRRRVGVKDTRIATWKGGLQKHKTNQQWCKEMYYSISAEGQKVYEVDKKICDSPTIERDFVSRKLRSARKTLRHHEELVQDSTMKEDARLWVEEDKKKILALEMELKR